MLPLSAAHVGVPPGFERGHRAKCPEEAKKAEEAAVFSETSVRSNKALLICDWDKYGGRVLGDVILADNTLLDHGRRPDPTARTVCAVKDYFLSSSPSRTVVQAPEPGPHISAGELPKDWCTCDSRSSTPDGLPF
jgi:hypothetical protein